MAENRPTVPQTEPENCTHVCGSCDAECAYNAKGTPGKFWQALDDFSRIDSEDLLNALNSFSEENAD